MSAANENGPRVAIVHDALVTAGGAERLVTFMCEAFPHAPVFTSAYSPDATFADFRHRQIHVLPGARWARDERRFKQMFLLWLWGFLRLDLSNFDSVLSSSTFGAKYVRSPEGTDHACYCYAPFRLLWKPGVYTPESVPVNWTLARILSVIRPFVRRLDFHATQQIPRLATSCRNMKTEIKACYDRDAKVIYPPVRLSDFQVGTGEGGYYLSVSRLISHKRVDLAIRACNSLGRPLVVVGYGPESATLKSLSGPDIRFAGRVSDAELRDLYANCRALIFPSHEDYGIVPLEVQACGRPVIAYEAGGVLETVVDGQTGVFFKEQTVDAVSAAIRRFETMKFDPRVVRQAVRQFDVDHFKHELREFVLNA